MKGWTGKSLTSTDIICAENEARDYVKLQIIEMGMILMVIFFLNYTIITEFTQFSLNPILLG